MLENNRQTISEPQPQVESLLGSRQILLMQLLLRLVHLLQFLPLALADFLPALFVSRDSFFVKL